MVTKISQVGEVIIPSTSTPGSMWILVICLTISLGEWRSINLLWILISYRSQVFDPSPLGVFLVVIFNTFVGNRTGPLTLRSLSFARAIKSAQTTQWVFHNRRSGTFLDIFDVTGGQSNADSMDLGCCLCLLFFFSSFSDWRVSLIDGGVIP